MYTRRACNFFCFEVEEEQEKGVYSCEKFFRRLCGLVTPLVLTFCARLGYACFVGGPQMPVPNGRSWHRFKAKLRPIL